MKTLPGALEAARMSAEDRLPGLLRWLLRAAEFRTRSQRMGKVARVGLSGADFWRFRSTRCERIVWGWG